MGTVHDGEREARFGLRVDQDRKHGGEIELGAVLEADGDPLARSGGGCGFRLLDVGRHDFPLARILVQHDMALGLHEDPALPHTAECGFHAADVLLGLEQADHFAAAQDQGLAIAPARIRHGSLPSCAACGVQRHSASCPHHSSSHHRLFLVRSPSPPHPARCLCAYALAAPPSVEPNYSPSAYLEGASPLCQHH